MEGLDSRLRGNDGKKLLAISYELIMSVAVKIRGIYSTALTRFFLDQGANVVSPSDPIISRFGKSKGLMLVGVLDVEIRDLEDREGIRIEGESGGVDEVTRALRDRFFDAVCRNQTTGSAELEFPFLAKSALDELRNRVLPTVPRHHHLRIIASDDVNLLEEKTLTGHPEKRESLPKHGKEPCLGEISKGEGNPDPTCETGWPPHFSF